MSYLQSQLVSYVRQLWLAGGRTCVRRHTHKKIRRNTVMMCRKPQQLNYANRLVTGCLLMAMLVSPLLLPVVTSAPAEAQSVRTVPEGNRYKSQPRIPFASSRRTSAASSRDCPCWPTRS